MSNQERTAPDCSGYVGMDHEHGAAVSVTPYRPPAPRRPEEAEAEPQPQS
jgi:hypothetical protein